MSTVNANNYKDRSGGNNATFNGKSIDSSFTDGDSDKIATHAAVSQAIDTAFQSRNVAPRASISTAGGALLHDVLGIPSWATRITVLFAGVSTNSTSNIIIQMGTGGVFETTAYLGSTQFSATPTLWTTGVLVANSVAAASIHHGRITLSRFEPTTDTWAIDGNIALSNGATVFVIAGSKIMTAPLDCLRLTTILGTNTFDAGSFSVSWE